MGSTRSRRRTVGAKYELLERLGTGGMSEVWMARNLATLRIVALKHMTPTPGDTASERRFFREAQLQAGIRHPGVADVLDAGVEADGSLYLVLEHLDGQDLERVFRAQRLRPRALLRVVIRVLDALGACHAAGLVHRDVKPSNIFLARSSTASFDVKLIDFGIAAKVSEHDEDLIVGTLETMAPEQARGEAADPRMDVYGAAAVLFRGLAGVPPVDALSIDDLVRAQEQGLRLRLQGLRPDLPSDIVEVIDKGLSAEPADRWPSADAMAAALMSCDHRALGACDAPRRPKPDVTVSLGVAQLGVGSATEAVVAPTVVRRKRAA